MAKASLPERFREHMWTAKKYAEWRGITEAAACTERYKGTGPHFHRLSGRIYYDPDDVLAWIEANRHHCTSDYSGVA